ncbi:Uncharacterised protein [Vibrio cholerae]|nr:Uncharacterised protein [Vibrio cholerae]
MFRVHDKENQITATFNYLKFQHFLPNQHQEKLKSQIVRLERLKLIIQGMNLNF